MLHRPNKTRAAKEGVIEPSAADLIRPFVAGPDEPPRYALHFGKVDKVGVNPKSKYDTPLAVCAYPLTEEIFDEFIRISLPFAQRDAKYLFLLEIKPNARVFYSTERFFNLGVGPEYLDVDVSNVKVRSKDSLFSRKLFYSTRPSDYALKEQYFVEGGTVVKAAQWGHKLWKMGIDVWVDADDEGILHGAEPSQVMFFNPSSYRVVLSMDNPKNTLQARFGRDWRKRKDIDVSPVERARAGYKNLRGADLRGAWLTLNLRGVDLSGANLTGAVLTRADLTGADLSDANLTGADLQDVRYDDSTIWPEDVRDVLRVWRGDKDLRGANLEGAYLSFVNLEGVDLRGADLRGANLRFADLTGAYLRDVRYDYSTIWPEDVRDVLRVWRGDKYLFRADLHRADLRDAILSGADLRFADLTNANLRGADLNGADLTRAYLTDADLTGAILDDIIYDDSTIWPEGFTPPPSAPRPNRR